MGFMNKIREFMHGRYGIDQLGIGLIVVGCILTFILSFIRVPFYRLIGLVPMILAVVRAISRQWEKRYAENARFMKVWSPVRKKLIEKYKQLKDKDHRYFKCPKCKRVLRVPKNRGKIEISCPHCQTKFKKRT